MRWSWSREWLIRGDDRAISRGARRLAEFSQSVFSYRGDSAIWSAGYRAGYRARPGWWEAHAAVKSRASPTCDIAVRSLARLALREKKYGVSQKYRDHGGAQHRCRWVILLRERAKEMRLSWLSREEKFQENRIFRSNVRRALCVRANAELTADVWYRETALYFSRNEWSGSNTRISHHRSSISFSSSRDNAL